MHIELKRVHKSVSIKSYSYCILHITKFKDNNPTFLQLELMFLTSYKVIITTSSQIVILVTDLGPNPSFFGDYYLTWGSVGTGAWTWKNVAQDKIKTNMTYLYTPHYCRWRVWAGWWCWTSRRRPVTGSGTASRPGQTSGSGLSPSTAARSSATTTPSPPEQSTRS